MQTSICAQSLDHVKHSEYVLQNLKKYQKLGDFLIKNADTLIFHNLNFYSTSIQEELKQDYCQNWSPPFSEDNLNSIPACLRKQFLRKTAKIDEAHLMLINVCLDKSVEFFVADDFAAISSEKTFLLIHILEYRTEGIDVPFKYSSLRDSLVHAQFNYGVVSVED